MKRGMFLGILRDTYYRDVVKMLNFPLILSILLVLFNQISILIQARWCYKPRHYTKLCLQMPVEIVSCLFVLLICVSQQLA